MDWDRVADEYTVVRESRREIVFPVVRDLIRNFKARTMLDYGGGDGEFAVMCASLSGLQITTFDPAPHMTAMARKRAGGARAVRVVDSVSDLAELSFDVITMNALWMCLQTEDVCLEVLEEASRLLANGGHLIASVTHPCFRDCRFSTYHTDFRQDQYLKEGIAFRVTLDDGSRKLDIVDTHWNLTTMSRQLSRAGFVITGINELPDVPCQATDGKGSPWMVIVAEKPHHHASGEGA